MKLRELEMKDAPFMYEWLHDQNVVEYLNIKDSNKTLDDCKDFIANSWNPNDNFHLAITDDKDTYMGTVSLKNINMEQRKAEFAIVVRTYAMGLGFSSYGMKQMLKIGYEEKGLDKIYWYVNTANTRAIRFYEKRGYHRMSLNNEFQGGGKNDYIWYQTENPFRATKI